MKGKKLLAMALAVLMLVPLFAGAVTASAEKPDGADYPTVFVHGLLGWGDEDSINKIMPYWGMTAGNVDKYLQDLGYNTYVASVGPVSSAWDRCCELFAQLAGTKVDYGQAHSDKCCAQFDALGYDLHHDRYGRDYTGKALIDENWGPIYEGGKVVGWYNTKVNLVGHSFGGPTIVEFLQLLAEGDQAEREWGMQQAALYGGDWHDYVSPLFWGDYNGEYLVNSLTTLAGVLNGTTFISACDDETAFLTDFVMMLGNAIGVTDLVGLYDFQLEHFGLTKTPGTDAKAYFDYLMREGFIAADDQAWYDLSVAGCNELKQGWETYDNVYYFSYAGDKTYKDLLGNNLPDPDMWLLFMPFSTKIGAYVNRYEFVDNVDGTRWGSINDEWKPNDGMVNSIAARCPLGAANKPYDENCIEPGVWNVYPDQDIDHLGFSGGILNSKPAQCKAFYKNLMEDIAATAPVFRATRFVDVPEESIYHDAILWAAENGVTNGVDATHFAPDLNCTRGQVVTMLWRAAGCPAPAVKVCPFTDVAKTSPYFEAIVWAAESGITKGVDATHFAPDRTVNRAEFVSFLYRYNDCPAAEGINPFADVSDGAWYCDAVLWAAENGITKGVDADHFAPAANCTRAQVAMFLYRAFA